MPRIHRLPSAILLLAPALASAQEEGKEPPRVTLRLGLGKGAGWFSKTHSVREEESTYKGKIVATIGGEKQTQEDSSDSTAREELDSRVKMEFLESEEGEVRRARFTLEEHRYRRRSERDGEVVEKDEGPKPAVIEGCEISFRWGEEENAVEVKGGSLEKEQREGFLESLKFRDLNPLAAYFLPKEPVAVGETWTLEGRPLRQILNHALGESEDEGRAQKALPKEVGLEIDLDGGLKAKLEELVEKDGRKVAVVSVAGKPKEEGSTDGDGMESSWKTAFDVTGTLRFLVDVGIPESLELAVEAKKQAVQSREHEDEDGEGGISFSGSSTVTVKREFRTVCTPLREPEEEPSKGEAAPKKNG